MFNATFNNISVIL